jgi:hypothetical protein
LGNRINVEGVEARQRIAPGTMQTLGGTEISISLLEHYRMGHL